MLYLFHCVLIKYVHLLRKKKKKKKKCRLLTYKPPNRVWPGNGYVWSGHQLIISFWKLVLACFSVHPMFSLKKNPSIHQRHSYQNSKWQLALLFNYCKLTVTLYLFCSLCNWDVIREPDWLNPDRFFIHFEYISASVHFKFSITHHSLSG